MARPKKRLILIGTQVVVILGLVLGLIGFIGSNKTVAVAIDGKEQEVTTFAGDVRGVLETGEIEIAAGDEISPSLDETVSDGDTITIARMKEIELEIDGQTETYTTTAATLSEFLETLDLDDDAQISADLGAELVSFTEPIEVRNPQTLTVTKYGEATKITTTANTIEEALAENDLELGKTHKLFRTVDSKNKSLKPTAAPADGMKLVIEVHSTKSKTETAEIPYETKRTNDNTLERGTEKVKTEGKVGVKTIKYTQKLVDGEVVEETKASEEVSKKPVNAEVLVGTKAPAPQQSSSTSNNSSGSSSSSNSSSSNSSSAPAPKANNTNVGGAWQALAQCESGGNWSINTGNGYYGGLQFSASSWAAAGGTQYAALPHQATPAQQIATAERLKSNGGWGHWPACSSRLGLR